MISFDASVRLDFKFKEHTTASLTKAAVLATKFGGTDTDTAGALALAKAQFLDPSSGVRPDSEAVSKVLVVLTDGTSNGVAATIAAAEDLKAMNVNVFTIGLGTSLNHAELQGMASDPKEGHAIELAKVKDIEGFSSTMATYSCNEPAQINPGEALRTEIKNGEMRYLTPSCKILTDHFIVDANDVQGSTSIFVSTTSQNPGPFSYDKKSETPGRKQIYMETPKISPIYVGVWSTRCGDDADAMVDADVSFNIFNDIFDGFMIDYAEVRERQSSGVEVYRPPSTPSFSGNVSMPTMVYSLENSTAILPSEDSLAREPSNATFPFAINQTNGVVTTSDVLEFEGKQEWTLRILARATGSNELSRCVRGGMVLIVTVIPDATTSGKRKGRGGRVFGYLLLVSLLCGGCCFLFLLYRKRQRKQEHPTMPVDLVLNTNSGTEADANVPSSGGGGGSDGGGSSDDVDHDVSLGDGDEAAGNYYAALQRDEESSGVRSPSTTDLEQPARPPPKPSAPPGHYVLEPANSDSNT